MLQTLAVQNIVQIIVEHQKAIIGPLAIEQAQKVPGIKIGMGDKIEVESSQNNASIILSSLVKKYEELFGLASVEVCKDAIKELKPQISASDLPDILR